MRDNSKLTGATIEAYYQFLAWLVPTIEKFPKKCVPSPNRRFALRISPKLLRCMSPVLERTRSAETHRQCRIITVKQT
jgi:hypothetical protein